jgi:hypothetical protein
VRIATVVLIVLAGSVPGHAQQLERPPFFPPRQEAPPRQLFPVAPLDPRVAPSAQQPTPLVQLAPAPPATRPQPGPSQRSGPVCLKTIPVDPSVDRGIVLPVPETRGLTGRVIEMPPCVTLAPQRPR